MRNKKNTLIGFALLMASQLTACTSHDGADQVAIHKPTTQVKYIASDKIIFNPERGMFTHHEFYSDKEHELTLEQLDQLKAEGMSLIFTVYVMKDFRNKEISASYLNKIKRNFKAIRSTGMKAIVRFCYTYSENDKPWDAPWEVTQHHIEQLKPILNEYADIIAIMEAGFIGVWGEWYYTDHYIYQPKYNQYKPRKMVLDALLDALPKDRSIAVRYPRAKRGIYQIQYSDSLTQQTAHNGSDLSRTAFHNDCFLATGDDMGTFLDNTTERQYWKHESKYLSMGGETCAPSEFTAVPNALKDFAAYHWTYLNKDYHPDVLAKWEREQLMTTIKKQLGYRLVLKEGTFTQAPQAGDIFNISLTIKNEGWAAPINPRNVEIIFKKGSSKYRVLLKDDPRTWYAGETHNIKASISLPATMPEGYYDVFLNLPDPYPTLHNRTDYSIQLANKDLWNKKEGYNKLITLKVLKKDSNQTSQNGLSLETF